MTTWTEDSKPSNISDPIWAEARELWNPADFEYIEFPWQYVPASIWTNDSK